MILTVDVGLRNLAFCIGELNKEEKFDIHLWNVYNTLESDLINETCKSVQKNGKICSKKCLYKYQKGDETIYSCKKHFPKDIPIKKTNTIVQKKIESYLLQDIASIVLKRVQNVFDNNKELFLKLDKILIELQPKINQKMKFVSHILYGKFVELLDINLENTKKVEIRFVRASQKLKAYTGPYIECKLKSKYSQRKWLSIQYTIWFLENKTSTQQYRKWNDFYQSCPKKDDLSDVYLMCINALHGLPSKQTRSKKGKCIK